MGNWQKDWKVIDIMELRGIHKDLNKDLDAFCEEQMNGSARLLELSDEEVEYYPVLVPFLVSQGYEKDSRILGWISW
jgi:hypothetical protein